jgi:hypothetical protein
VVVSVDQSLDDEVAEILARLGVGPS